MGHRQAHRHKALLLLLATVLLLSACSRINLAYRNLDLLIPWSLNDYLDMNRTQEARFKTQLDEHLAWHCRTQLPVYLAGLDAIRRHVETQQINPTTLRTHLAKTKQAIDAIAVEVTPSVTQLLGTLEDHQVRTLRAALEEDRREHLEKYLQPPLAQQIRERAERMEERIEHWTGRLDAAQRQRILQWSHALGEQNRLWLENRAQWQDSLLTIIDQRGEADFASRLARLLQERKRFWTAGYRRSFARSEQAAIDLISDLYAMADDNQRRHLSNQLQDLSDDLGSLGCLAAQ